MDDWRGNATSIFATHGASNHSDTDRAERDYYATDPEAVEALLRVERFKDAIYEPACGGGHISQVMITHGHDVVSTDIVNRGSVCQTGVQDFLSYCPESPNTRDIITNPPYKYAMEFAQKALDISEPGVKVAMFLKLTFLEGGKRKRLFDEHPPKKVYVFRNRIDCWKNGVKPDKPAKAVCYAWFVWEKGFVGPPEIAWL